jgi:hypothetical protein
LLNEKETFNDEEKTELRKKVLQEKKKNEQMMDFVNKFKDESMKKHAIIVQEILNKEEEIKKLKQAMNKMATSARKLGKMKLKYEERNFIKILIFLKISEDKFF